MGNFLGKAIASILSIVTVAVFLVGCENSSEKTGTLMDFVPQGASLVFKISNFETVRGDIESNALLSKFGESSPYLLISKSTFLQNLRPKNESVLSINKIDDSTSFYTFISKQHPQLFVTDSLKDKTIETLTVDDFSFQRVTLAKETVYTTTVDSIFIASSSQKILQEILKGNTEKDETFGKVYNLPNAGQLTALLRENNVSLPDSAKVNFTSWSALNLQLSPESLTATGITLATDTIPQLLNIFKDQIPQPNGVADLAPANARGALSFTFNDAEKFQKELRIFRGENENAGTTGIFGSVSEAGKIDLGNSISFFVKSIDPSLTTDVLARYLTLENSFREVEISAFSEPDLFKRTFAPLLDGANANYIFQLENFFVFTENVSDAETIISAFQNNSTLKNTTAFEENAPVLSNASSLLILKMKGDFGKDISLFLNEKSETLKNASFDGIPLAAIQFSYDRNFAHVTFTCKETSGGAVKVGGSISEKFNTKLENALLGAPQLFGNGTNVVTQDISNVLYFISESGKILWKKKLENAILGKIQEIDIYGNGNKQLAFATKNNFYIIDRNGNDVTGFPIKFRDNVTQPLSVFDYDNNHNYRFVITQGKQVLMYDKGGKTVKGFGFEKAKSAIVQPPKHIRMGNKDYILIAEENGKLNILSRVGKTRVSVSKDFDFSEIPVAEEDSYFVVITKDNTKIRIDQNGKISTQKLDVGGSYWFAMEGNTKATLDDNLLRIDGKLAELPIGLYSKPQLFTVDRNVYVTITETQENKVYVFDESAKIVDGFPIYGTSTATLAEGGPRKSIAIAVKGESDTVIYYLMN
ncbi:hypothetical protein [Aequorivita echinoideorum]|uniref:Uncharacterized protein n=1 Tax=Aequorivita echinoideorum TaxID=1549647 RepID=A0ABS5S2S8_9FLAO|nr:hypothetical protein [Aequorivita echinoideorum]MBT0607504.1 hypothetical protein [Aequorivita echinoideorum]